MATGDEMVDDEDVVTTADAPQEIPVLGSTVPLHYPIEIHHISVSAGDATVIAVRNGVKKQKVGDAELQKPSELILIDAGKSNSDLEVIKTYCKSQFGRDNFDKVIVSHAHKDHFGALPSSDIFENGTTQLIMGPGANVFTDVKKIPNRKTQVRTVKLGLGLDAFTLKLGDAEFVCCCAGAVPFGGKAIKEKCKDDNDNSMVWVLKYQGFRYFTAGDLSGVTEGNYNDIEGPLLEYLYKETGPLHGIEKVHVMKATHHGSKFSSYGSNTRGNDISKSFFLEKLRPEVIIIPCNNSISPPLPTPDFFARAKPHVEKLILVNQFYRNKEKTYNKYLNINLDDWKSKINIREVAAAEKKPAYYTNTKPLLDNHLPVSVVGVLKGNYTIHNKWLEYKFTPSAANVNSSILQFVPNNIPSAYFGKYVLNEEGSYIELVEPLLKKILIASNIPEITSAIDEILDMYEDSQKDVHTLKKKLENPELLFELKKFNDKFDFTGFLNNIGTVERGHDNETDEYDKRAAKFLTWMSIINTKENNPENKWVKQIIEKLKRKREYAFNKDEYESTENQPDDEDEIIKNDSDDEDFEEKPKKKRKTAPRKTGKNKPQ